MIKPLMDFFEIKFPVSLLSKKDNETPTETTNKVSFGDKYVLKSSKNLLDAFNINNTYIPKTLAFCNNPESFLSSLDLVKTNYILDSDFNVFLPQKYLSIEYHTLTLYQEYPNYLRVKEYSYFFKKLIEKDEKNTKPLFALVNRIAYFIGWHSEPIHIEIKL